MISAEHHPASGEFGWTLPSGEGPLSISDLAELIGQSGVNWVKFPVWTSLQDAGRNDRIMWLSERLHLQQVELVGLLHMPPPEVLSKLGDVDHPLAAQVFSTEPELWYPSLEPTLTSLSLKLRWWQLGLDKDVSFVGYPKGPEKIARVRKFISRFGQQVNLGIGWSWLNELPREQAGLGFCLTFGRSPADLGRAVGISRGHRQLQDEALGGGRAATAGRLLGRDACRRFGPPHDGGQDARG